MRRRPTILMKSAMTEVHHTKAAFRFGRFELDVRARELRKDGVRIRLQDQPFELLAMLLERPVDGDRSD